MPTLSTKERDEVMQRSPIINGRHGKRPKSRVPGHDGDDVLDVSGQLGQTNLNGNWLPFEDHKDSRGQGFE